MLEKFIWIVFRAHPSALVEDEDFHPDFLGTFVCPALRPEPEELLGEVLSNRKLTLIDVRSSQVKSGEDDWGMNERLKKSLQEGYALSLVKMHVPPNEMA